MSNEALSTGLYHPAFESSWTRHSLHSLATWINGMAFRSINFAPTGTPVVKITEIKNGISAQTKFTQGTYDDKYLLVDGDMLFCWSGQPESSIDTYWWRGGDGWLNQHIFKVLPNAEVVDRGFFFQLLRYLRPNIVRIAQNKQTTGLGHVTKGDLERLMVAVPPRPEQQLIAATLSTLDDKIESNHRLMDLIPQAIRAHVDGALSSASLSVPVATLARFINGGAYTKGASGYGAHGLADRGVELGARWLDGLQRHRSARGQDCTRRRHPNVMVRITGSLSMVPRGGDHQPTHLQGDSDWLSCMARF